MRLAGAPGGCAAIPPATETAADLIAVAAAGVARTGFQALWSRTPLQVGEFLRRRFNLSFSFTGGTMARNASLILIALLMIAGLAAGRPALAAGPSDAAPETGVNGTHFDAGAATAAYLATLSPQARARSDAYFEGGYWLILWDFLVTLAVALLLLGAGWSGRMRDVAERLTRIKALQTILYALQYLLLTALLTLPWAAYQGYFREHQYGMSNQTGLAWLVDQGKGLAVGLILGSVAITAIYAVIRRSPRNWWVWGTLVAVALLLVQVAITPTLLEPVFNRFYPLPDGPVKQQILSMARANGIPVGQVFEFDASKQTTRISAHVSGLFGSAQISVNDNLMKRASPEEVRAVVGHEMGHYVLNHIDKSVIDLGLVVLVGFRFLSWAFDRLAARYGPRWRLRGVADTAGLPLLLALFSAYGFLMTPVLNSITRAMEIEADAFGLNAARQPDGAAQAALHLSEYRKLQPGPVEEFVFFDHPSGWNRIHRAMLWKAENIDAADIAAYDAAHHPPGSTR